MKLIKRSDVNLIFRGSPSMLISWAILAGAISCWLLIFFTIGSVLVKLLCIVGSAILVFRIFEHWRELTFDKLSGNITYKDESLFQRYISPNVVKVVGIKEIRKINTDFNHDKILFFCNQNKYISANFSQNKGSLESYDKVIRDFLQKYHPKLEESEEPLEPQIDARVETLPIVSKKVENFFGTGSNFNVTEKKLFNTSSEENLEILNNGKTDVNPDDNTNNDKIESKEILQETYTNEQKIEKTTEKCSEKINKSSDIVQNLIQKIDNNLKEENSETQNIGIKNELKNYPNNANDVMSTNEEIEKISIVSCLPTSSYSLVDMVDNAVSDTCTNVLEDLKKKESRADVPSNVEIIGDAHTEDSKNVSVENVQNIVGKIKEKEIVLDVLTEEKVIEEKSEEQKLEDNNKNDEADRVNNQENTENFDDGFELVRKEDIEDNVA